MINSKQCYLCDSFELVGVCIRCSKPYCARDTSKIDTRYCDECMRDVVIVEDIYTKTEEDYNDKNHTITTHKTQCKQISFSGIDWMFACQRIAELSDEDVKPILEYHRGMVYQLETELTNRSIKKQREQIRLNVNNKVFTVQKEVTVKERRVTKPAQTASMDKIADMLIKMGITDLSTINELLSKKVQ